MFFYIKSYVHALVFFLTLISFIRYKVTVMVLICFLFPSWITNEFLKFCIKVRNLFIQLEVYIYRITSLKRAIWRKIAYPIFALFRRSFEMRKNIVITQLISHLVPEMKMYTFGLWNVIYSKKLMKIPKMRIRNVLLLEEHSINDAQCSTPFLLSAKFEHNLPAISGNINY